MHKRIQDFLSSAHFVRIFCNWLFDLKFQLKMLRCCLSTKENFDLYNVSSVVAFYGIPLSLFALIITLLLTISFSTTTIFLICFCLSIIFFLISMYSFYKVYTITELYYQKSESHLNGTQNSIFLPDKPHHGIVFAQQTDHIRKLFISDTVDLLVSLFDEKIPFKVYPIYHEDDFKIVYSNPNINWLWIIGHGWSGGFVYSENESESKINYSQYEKNPNLLFIAQLHCNDGTEKTLIEINELTPDHDIGHFRFPFQNRCFITKKIKSFFMT